MPAGRPTEYKASDLPKLRELAAGGATDLEMADYLGVSNTTFYRWKHQHKEFRHTLKLGKAEADENVEQSLYQRARGYSVDTVKVFCTQGEVTKVPIREHYPPDTTAAIFWLKNRKPNEWRDKSEVEIPGLSALAERISKARSRK
jgi:hypothetical protein